MEKIMTFDFENSTKTPWCHMLNHEKDFINQAVKMGARLQKYCLNGWDAADNDTNHHFSIYRIHPEDLTDKIKAIASQPTQPIPNTPPLNTNKMQDALARFQNLISDSPSWLKHINIGDVVTFDTYQRADGVVEFAPSEKFVDFMDQLEREQSQKFTSPLDLIKDHKWQTKDGRTVVIKGVILEGEIDVDRRLIGDKSLRWSNSGLCLFNNAPDGWNLVDAPSEGDEK